MSPSESLAPRTRENLNTIQDFLGMPNAKAITNWRVSFGKTPPVNSRYGYEAYEQLAIYYEHKARDPEQALELVRQAIGELTNALQTPEIAPGAYREFKTKFDRRVERLVRKSQRPLLNALAIAAQA